MPEPRAWTQQCWRSQSQALSLGKFVTARAGCLTIGAQLGASHPLPVGASGSQLPPASSILSLVDLTGPRRERSSGPSQQQQGDGSKRQQQDWAEAGWTWSEVCNLPNSLSLARLASGPFISALIVNHNWSTAFIAISIAAVTDWLDGAVAKRWHTNSVLGSYLDPLADKVLVCCVVGALGYEGSLPVWLATVIIGRDVLLVG
ncbi:hypothetical protein WJX84_003158 [Apatococcus fuscideae]|uniref:Uncharacterized protein n=1 Tax=Apatococcus fuscideae TaxID=2026836 RepID=A0AAW1TDK5_9CHLO